MRAKFRKNIKVIFAFISTFLLLYPSTAIEISAAEPSAVNIKIDTTADRKLISPYIYGINDTSDLSELTVRSIKQGGNRLSTYNWENNFSNSGSDWFNTSDNSLVSSFDINTQKSPALAVESLYQKSVKYNIPFILTTLPMCGYVAADGNGPILDSQTAPSDRWIEIKNKKPAPLSLTPDLSDDAVYVDEYLNYIINKYGKATKPSAISAYSLDNEPDLWSTSHSTIHADDTTIDELIQKSVSLAEVIKGIDETAVVFGGQFSGMNAFISFNDTEDWGSYKNEYNWFIDYYLSKIKSESAVKGKRLIDILDLHYYSEESTPEGASVVENDDYTDLECNKVRMQSTRTLWDSTYTENSWIGKSFQQYLPLLPTIQASINKYYSGTKLAFSEYNFGGGGHISGGIAEADALGIFAKEGVYFASLNPNEGDISYLKSAINIFTNYDGYGSSFGNTNINAETSNNEFSSVYASIDNADENTVKLILINKNYNTKQTANIQINSSIEYKGGISYGFSSKSSDIVKYNNITNIKNNEFKYEMPPLSVVELILTSDGSIPIVTTSDYSYSGSYVTDNQESDTTVIDTTLSESSTTASTSNENLTSSLSTNSSAEYSSVITDKAVMPPMVEHRVPFVIKLVIIGVVLILVCCISYLFLSDSIKK